VARAFGHDVKDIPRLYGRRKLKAIWQALVDKTNDDMLRAAMATRAGSLADEKGWREFTDSLSGEVSTPVEAPTIAPGPRRVDDDDWETIDDG
jgi:hypothetical protein